MGNQKHSLLTGSELHVPGYQQDSGSDPGPVGAGKYWFQTDTQILLVRNATNSGWVTIHIGINDLGIDSSSVWSAAKILQAMQDSLPIGTKIDCGVGAPPSDVVTSTSDWCICDGRQLSSATYPILAAALGSLWGSTVGGTVVTLPDFRGMFIRGAGTNAAHPTHTATLGHYQEQALQSHSHSIPLCTGSSLGSHVASGNVSNSNTGTTNSTGGTETVPANYALAMYIKISQVGGMIK